MDGFSVSLNFRKFYNGYTFSMVNFANLLPLFFFFFSDGPTSLECTSSQKVFLTWPSLTHFSSTTVQKHQFFSTQPSL